MTSGWPVTRSESVNGSRQGRTYFPEAFFGQCPDGNTASIGHGMWLGVRGAGPLDLFFAHHGFGVIAGFLGKEFLRAGIKRAQSTRTAHGRPLIIKIRAGAGEGKGAHDLVRPNRITQQEPRTIFGAVTTLIARRFPDSRLRFGRLCGRARWERRYCAGMNPKIRPNRWR